MADKINGGVQAFPVADMGVHGSYGMTLRDWFAGQALPALVEAAKNQNEPAKIIATAAYEVADAMLAARKAGA